MINLGAVPAGTTIYIPFATYDANGASVTMTGLAVTDIEIYKNGSVTQRASDAGYTLLDTDGIDFDGLTGIHGFSIDLNDNTDAGFFAVGSWYWVVVSAVTVSTQAVSFVAAVFRIAPAEGVAGYPKADTSHIAGSAVSTSSAQIGVNVVNAAGTAWASGAITAAVIATDAIDDDALAANAVTAIQSGLATAAALDAVDNFIDTEIADIQARLPAVLSSGRIKADIEAVGASTTAVDRMKRALNTEVLGTVGSASTTTSVVASSLVPASVVNDQFVGLVMKFDMDTATTALRGQATIVTDYVHATLTFTVTALTTAPASGDTFVLL